MMRLIIFPDAGFSPLSGSHSIDGSVTVLAEVISRDGLISCRGTLLDRRCAKIQRVCKSSVASEWNADVAASDQALRTQALLREIITCAYEIRHISPPSQFPLPGPLGPPPTDNEAKWQYRENNPKRRIFHPQAPRATSQFQRHFCCWHQQNGIINELPKNSHCRHYCFDHCY